VLSVYSCWFCGSRWCDERWTSSIFTYKLKYHNFLQNLKIILRVLLIIIPIPVLPVAYTILEFDLLSDPSVGLDDDLVDFE